MTTAAGSDPFAPLSPVFFERPGDEVAPALLGRYLVRRLDGERLVLRIVETEAYLGAPDRASHAWEGRRTRRTASLFLPPGHVYVYLIYGLHHCLNLVTGGEPGAAVLVRAGAPVAGEEAMWSRRPLDRAPRPGDVAGGPGKLCQALDIGRELDGTLIGEDLDVTVGEPVDEEGIACGPRIGVDYAGDAASWPLRFAVAGDPHVSRPRP